MRKNSIRGYTLFELILTIGALVMGAAVIFAVVCILKILARHAFG